MDWRQWYRLGRRPAPLLPEPTTAARPDQEEHLLRLREQLWLAIHFFQQGDGERALGAFEEVLVNPLHVPAFRLVALCLRGEIRRGRGEYGQAEASYREAIAVADAQPPDSWANNEWYARYRPRAQLGLVTTHRRILAAEPEKTRWLLDDATRLGELGNPDFGYQLDAVRGTWLRSQGELEAAATTLLRAAADARSMEVPDCLFWYPEQIRAHAVLACFLAPGQRMRARLEARALRSSETRDAWSRTVAGQVLLHLLLQDLLREGETQARGDRLSALHDTDAAPGMLLAETRSSADRCGDPALITESLVLEAAWASEMGRLDASARAVRRLAAALPAGDMPLTLLRAAEAAVIPSGEPPPAALTGRGVRALAALRQCLTDYRCPSSVTRWADTLLDSDGQDVPGPAGLYQEPLQALRARLWP